MERSRCHIVGSKDLYTCAYQSCSFFVSFLILLGTLSATVEASPATPALLPQIMSVLSSPTTATCQGSREQHLQMCSTAAGSGFTGRKSRVTT